MSKSLKNFITVRDFLKNYSPPVLRFLVASHHYRSPLDYKDELAKQAEQSLLGIRNFLIRLSFEAQSRHANGRLPDQEIASGWIKSADLQFENAMEDDFNTSDALAALFWLIKQVEPKIWQVNKKEAALIRRFLTEKLAIFGLSFPKPAPIPPSIKQMAKKRELYRANKQFIQADALRKKINALKYIIEDTPIGPLVYARLLQPKK